MKNNHYRNSYLYLMRLFAFLLLLFGGCTNTNIKKEINKETALKNEKKQVIASEESNIGTYYSDSMVELSSKQAESVEIDSFIDLHNFDRTKFQFENCNEFTIKMLICLDEYGIHDGVEKTIKYPKVTKRQKKLLGVTEYLCDKTFKDNFAMYIFHSRGVESHFSNSIQLFTISNRTNKYNSLVLSQKYLSEGYEYDLTSRFISINEVEVTKEERFNTSNISSKDDSTRLKKTNYFISEEGDIVLVN